MTRALIATIIIIIGIALMAYACNTGDPITPEVTEETTVQEETTDTTVEEETTVQEEDTELPDSGGIDIS